MSSTSICYVSVCAHYMTVVDEGQAQQYLPKSIPLSKRGPRIPFASDSTPLTESIRNQQRATYQKFLTPSSDHFGDGAIGPNFSTRLKELTNFSGSSLHENNVTPTSADANSLRNSFLTKGNAWNCPNSLASIADPFRERAPIDSETHLDKPERFPSLQRFSSPAGQEQHPLKMFDKSATPNPSKPKGQEQRSRLSEISLKLTGVEKSLENRTANCLQIETARIQFFREAIGTLEKKLNNEIRQRIESHKSINSMLEQQLQYVTEKLEGTFANKLVQFSDIIHAVEGKLASLENNLSAIDGDDTERRLATEVATSMEEIQRLKDQIPKMGETRNKLFIDQLGQIEATMAIRFEEEKAKRNKRLTEMRDECISFKENCNDNAQLFQGRIVNELNTLKESIVRERNAREQADDDIVVALKQYTLALHNALATNNGDKALDL